MYNISPSFSENSEEIARLPSLYSSESLAGDFEGAE